MKTLRTPGGVMLAMRRSCAALILLAACSHDPFPPAVASVTVIPPTATVLVGGTTQFTAIVKDAGGAVLSGHATTWSSGNAAAAVVSPTGLVTGMAAHAEPITITATSEGVSGNAIVSVTAPPVVTYASATAGTYHGCGRTLSDAAYCWGDNRWGELGDGTTISALTPVAVTGGLSFTVVGVGGTSNCGLTAAGAAYCWGSDFYGTIGGGTRGPDTCTNSDGDVPCAKRPVAVAGGHVYATLAVGWGRVCGLDASGAAYCWGDNAFGTLGIGSDTTTLEACGTTVFPAGPCSRTPLAVAGGLRFTALGAGTWHVCGLTASGSAYCWGDDRFGQLGSGSDTLSHRCDSVGPCSRTPLPVSGGLTFTKLAVGYAHSCGLATDGIWYCWGLNNVGQLGTGTTGPEVCRPVEAPYPCSRRPVAVAGGIAFTTVFPGGLHHSCGVTAGGVAYCWGENLHGQLGDGTTTNSLTAVAVAGGLTFASVSPYVFHTCGITAAGVAYCWGRNTWGNLGDGTTNNSSVPVRVAGQGKAVPAGDLRTRVVHHVPPNVLRLP